MQKNVAESYVQTDKNGEAVLAWSDSSTINLQLDFCPEKIISISVPDPMHRNFDFKMEPSIMEIYFKNFLLEPVNGELKGQHPLLPGNEFIYSKS